MSRTEQRLTYGEPIRISMLEHDVDTLEASLATTNKLLFGILISVTTASIVLAINVAVGAFN